MKLILYFLIFYWLLLQVYYAAALINLYAINKNASRLGPELKSRAMAVLRRDRKFRLIHLLYYLVGSTIIFPARLTFTILFMVFYIVPISGLAYFVENMKEQDEIQIMRKMTFRKLVVKLSMVLISYLYHMSGVSELKTYQVENVEFSNILEPDFKLLVSKYKVKENRKIPHCYISNHVSYFDIMFLLRTICPSFMAKSGIRKLKILGNILKCFACIFVDRSSAESRIGCNVRFSEYQDLVWAQEIIMRNNGDSAVTGQFIEYVKRLVAISQNDFIAKSIIIFPEGTTNNSRYMLPFRTGAFKNFTPVTPIVLVYESRVFSPAYDVISFMYLLPLVLGSINSISLTAFVLPQQMPTVEEIVKQDAQSYCKRMQTLMCNVFSVATRTEPVVLSYMKSFEIKNEVCKILNKSN